MIAYLKSPTKNPDFSCEKFLDFLHRTEVSAILAYFCSNLVAMATPLAPLKILLAYCNWTAPVHAINFPISCRELISAILWPKFGCHGNHPDSHEILYTIFEFADPKTFECDKFLDFWHRTEISAILAYFCLNLVAMATPLAPLKFWIAYLNSPTLKTLLLLRKSPRFLRRSEVCNFGFFAQIWLPW